MRRNLELFRLTTTAILMAITLVFSRVPGLSGYIAIGGVNLIKVGFQAIPLMICSVVCGPIYGLFCGAGADLIGALAFPTGGAFLIGFTIDAALLGLFPGFIMKLIKGKRLASYISSLIMILISSVIFYIILPFLNEFKIGDFKLELTLLWRILIPSIYFLVMAILATVFYLISRKEKKPFSLIDMFAAFAIRDLLVTPIMTALWMQIYFNVMYQITYSSQLITRAIQLPINMLITYFLLWPLSIVVKNLISYNYENNPLNKKINHHRLTKGIEL